MKKIAIVSISRAHLFNLAKTLQNKDDVDVIFYTLTPISRLRKHGYNGRAISFAFPLAFFHILFHKIGNFKLQYDLVHCLRNWFDYACSWFIKPCDILIGQNGDAYRTSAKAKKKFNATIICDQGSSHIKAQDAYYDELKVYHSTWNTNNLLSHYKISDFLMTPSVYVRSTDIQYGIKNSKILYNPYGADMNEFPITNKPINDCYDLIFVGNWCVRKGCDMLPKACTDLGVSLLHVGYITACDFPQGPLFKHYDNVPQHKLVDFYKKAKVFILPSRNEGLGLVVLQAVACGLTVVTSKNAGGVDVKQLIGDDKSIFIIDEPLSVETIKKSISEALKYANNMPEGPRNQNKDSIKNITWDAYGERYYEILKHL